MKTRKASAVSLVLAAGLFASLGAVSSDAVACGGEWMPAVEVDHRIQGIARAEKLFNDGRTKQAAASVIRMMPHVATLNPKRSKLTERAQRILAVAVARADGALAVGAEVPSYAQTSWLGKSVGHRQANLSWSVATLRKVNELKKDDPTVQTDLAEALSKVDANRAEARQILEALAKKDLVATPEGYAVLAELRSEAGDANGQKLALQRCEAMAKSSSVCRVSSGAKAQG